MIDHPPIRDTADSLEAIVMYRVARRFKEDGNVEIARYCSQQVLEYWAEFSEDQSRLSKLDHRQ